MFCARRAESLIALPRCILVMVARRNQRWTQTTTGSRSPSWTSSMLLPKTSRVRRESQSFPFRGCMAEMALVPNKNSCGKHVVTRGSCGDAHTYTHARTHIAGVGEIPLQTIHRRARRAPVLVSFFIDVAAICQNLCYGYVVQWRASKL